MGRDLISIQKTRRFLQRSFTNNDVAVTDEEIKLSCSRINSTRITTDDNEYNIAMVYDAWYLLVRMRQVWYDVNNIRIMKELGLHTYAIHGLGYLGIDPSRAQS